MKKTKNKFNEKFIAPNNANSSNNVSAKPASATNKSSGAINLSKKNVASQEKSNAKNIGDSH